jgi:hypothetical protein
MRAPRALAASRSSSIITAEPSLITNPSRVASNGREAVVGSPLAEASPRIEQKPARMSGWMQASVPPASTASA